MEPAREAAPEFAPQSASPPAIPSPPGPLPWRGRDLGFFIAFAAATLVLANFLALAAYALLRPLMGWHMSAQDAASNPIFLVVTQSLYYGLLMAYIYVLVAVHYDLHFWKGLGWRSPTPRSALRFMMAGVVLGFIIARAPNLLPERQNFPLEELFNSPQGAYAVAIFAIVAAPLVEEIIFRGVLFAFFERLVGLRFAITATALLFAGLHVPEYWGAWNHVFLILVVAFALSLARGLTGSLASSILLHFSYNFSLMIALFLSSQHFRSIHGLLLR
ncbi:MAG TPA: CPBP family intramembrane glutamic endopeptidase [Terriglobia bacterium]|nr:CPBP family intramembrane glutamic endopeptidase [Terriglobia bacterium]